MSSPFAVVPPLPVRGPACPPPETLEARVAGDSSAASVQEHLAGCEDCQGYVRALDESADVFRKQRPPELFLRQVHARAERKPRRWWVGIGVALAAGLALVGVLPRELGRSAEDVRMKGSPFSVVYRRAGMDAPAPVPEDFRARPGDALRFFYRAPRAGFVAVLEVDGTHRASVLYPYGQKRSTPLEKNRREPLAGALTLDDSPGPEWLVAVFSSTETDLERWRQQLEAAPEEAAAFQCEGCTVSVLRIQKN